MSRYRAPAQVSTQAGPVADIYYQDWIYREQEPLHKSAHVLARKSCQRCGLCCLRKPCVPTPAEFPVIADYLGLTPSELFARYCVVDGPYTNIFPVWAQETQADLLGRYLPSPRTYDHGYCIFFTRDNACQIHAVRPATARVTQCWDKPDNPERARRDALIESELGKWSLARIQAICPSFSLPRSAD